MSNDAKGKSPDRLYDLLPVIYRKRDAEQGYPLRALLQVIAEQVNLVEEDIDQLYENWFIETCQDWAVPYIGDLVGYRPVHEAGEPGPVTTARSRERNKILIPRCDVANTVRYRRRKGTLALLELLARDVSGWPSRAVEFYTLLSYCQALNHLRLNRGQLVDLRKAHAIDNLDGPFDELAHSLDVRRVSSHRRQGRYNIAGVGVFVWPMRVYSVTRAPAYCPDKNQKPNCFTFDVLGHDVPLFTLPETEVEPTHIAEELNLPVPITRRAFREHKADYYGEGKSLQIWRENEDHSTPVPLDQIIVANLSDWSVVQKGFPGKGRVAIDPETGRIAFNPNPQDGLKRGVKVTYHYGFSSEIGGGEYERRLSQPEGAKIYRVGRGEAFKSVNEALDSWMNEKTRPNDAVIEIVEGGVFGPTEEKDFPEAISLGEGQSLQIRAGNGARPVIRLPDRVSVLDYFTLNEVEKEKNPEKDHKGVGGRLVLDGLISSQSIKISGNLEQLTLRHCTLVPGTALLELENLQARINIEHSILGSIRVSQDAESSEPLRISIIDSILDPADTGLNALCNQDDLWAHALLRIERCTVLGKIWIHVLELAENCVFADMVKVARSQIGCMRFCHIPFTNIPDGSVTPRRYHCQPDLAMEQAKEELEALWKNAADNTNQQGAQPSQSSQPSQPSEAEIKAARSLAENRVRPQFWSTSYGDPGYCRLARPVIPEIWRGADDESEMGVFHDLFQPQREANLRARLEEHVPAGMDCGIIWVEGFCKPDDHNKKER